MARRNSSVAAQRMSAMDGWSPPTNCRPSRKNERNASSGSASAASASCCACAFMASAARGAGATSADLGAVRDPDGVQDRLSGPGLEADLDPVADADDEGVLVC